ncbi:MAG: HDOD domain-containing protein [Polyangiaceae bacterium]
MFGFFKRKRIDPKQRLAESLGELDLPSFSAATLNTLRLLRDPTRTAEEIAESIEANPGVVVRLLRMVNSAAYGLAQRVEGVSHAVSLLGRGKVESVVVAIAVKGSVDASSGPLPRFWQLAAARATIARGLAELIHPQTQSEAFVAGLLQDMAMPLLLQARPAEYRPMIESWQRDPREELTDLERKHFGWDHSEVGASVAHHWELPDPLIDAIGAHHLGTSMVPPAIHLVSHVQPTEGRVNLEPLVEAATASYNVPADRVVRAVSESYKRGAALARLLG